MKSIRITKKEVKLSMFANDTLLYMEKPKHFTQNSLDLISLLANIASYKISRQKPAVFLYANELTGREIKKDIPFRIATKTQICRNTLKKKTLIEAGYCNTAG